MDAVTLGFLFFVGVLNVGSFIVHVVMADEVLPGASGNTANAFCLGLALAVVNSLTVFILWYFLKYHWLN